MGFIYCPNCFHEGYDGVRCGVCNYQEQGPGRRASLAPGIQLKQRYLIGRVLGEGGFGVTYLALDMKYRQRCAIKEYFPLEFSVRAQDDVSVTASTLSKEEVYQHGLEKFMDEAKNLNAMSEIENIVNIWDYFKENGTAYFTMNFLDGCTLREEFKNSGKKIAYERATPILLSAIQTLGLVHEKGLIHRDISPENIFLTKSGRVVLIDFGAARGYLKDEKNADDGLSFSILLKHNFAPIEQYYTTGVQGTWTDVYALASTYYYIVSGQKVPIAIERTRKRGKLTELSSLCSQVPPKLSKVINRALEPNYRKRIQNMAQFYAEISKAIPPVPPPPPVPPSAPGKVKAYISRIDANGKKQRWLLPPNKRMLMGRTMRNRCDIVIDREDRMVSREHCYVTYLSEGNVFQICDQSMYGTFGPHGRLEKNKNIQFPAGTMFFTVSPKYQFLLEVE